MAPGRWSGSTKSPPNGPTLPRGVLLLQSLFKYWTDRCSGCHKLIDLDDIPITLIPLGRADVRSVASRV